MRGFAYGRWGRGPVVAAAALASLLTCGSVLAQEELQTKLGHSGMQAFREGRYVEAARDFRVARFLALEKPARHLEMLARQALAEDAAGMLSERDETLERFFSVERQFGAYESASLEPDLRGRFQALVEKSIGRTRVLEIPTLAAEFGFIASRPTRPPPRPTATASFTPVPAPTQIPTPDPPTAPTPEVPSLTATETAPIPSETATPRPSPTLAATRTPTPTPSPSAAPSTTHTPTRRPPSPSSTWTSTSTSTPVATQTPRPSLTQTPTETPTPPPSPTAVPSRTWTPTPRPPTPSATRTLTFAPTAARAPRLSPTLALLFVAPGLVDSPPEAVEMVMPIYPERALKERVRGLVVLRVLVAEDGTPVRISVEKAAREDLTRAAIAAARQWRFEPALKSGRPVRTFTTIRFPFEGVQFARTPLQQPDAASAEPLTATPTHRPAESEERWRERTPRPSPSPSPNWRERTPRPH